MAILAKILILTGVVALYLATEVLFDVGFVAFFLAPRFGRSLRRMSWAASIVGALFFIAGVGLLHRV